MKKIKIIAIVVLIIVLAILLGYKLMFTKVSSSDEEIEIAIPLGTGTNGIANILKENNIIRSKAK